MASEVQSIADQIEIVLNELVRSGGIRSGHLVVFGVSTSEVQGQHIGTSGAESVAEQIYEGVERVRSQVGFHPIWQCCEHLNRALVTTRDLADAQSWTEVSAIPVRKAGGSMAAFAYRQLTEPCLVEAIQAHAGIDIGETMIGMHLRPVAIPLRPSIRTIGQARVAMAITRPKLIGGVRAVYERSPEQSASDVETKATTCD